MSCMDSRSQGDWVCLWVQPSEALYSTEGLWGAGEGGAASCWRRSPVHQGTGPCQTQVVGPMPSAKQQSCMRDLPNVSSEGGSSQD